MLELSALVKKNVIARSTSCIMGCIKDVYFEKNCSEIAYFIIENAYDEICLLKPDELDSFEDAVTTQSAVCARRIEDVDFTKYASNLIGKQVFTQNGTLKGEIENVLFSKNGKICKLCLSDFCFSPQNVALAGDVIMLKAQKHTQKQRKISLPTPQTDATAQLFTPSKTENKNDQSNQQNVQPITIYNAPPASEICGINMLFSENAVRALGAQPSDDNGAIPRIISDYDFLLGRVMSKDAYDFSGKPFAKQGDIVTDALIQKARRLGKLAQLVLLAR